MARERLPDLADSIMPKYPNLLGISEDEGTAWVVRGDTATIVGRNKAFVYGGGDPTDAGRPFLTLHPGDRYNLATRRVMRRAADDSPVTLAFIDSLFKKYADPSAGGATVLVAQNGSVFVDQGFGIPAQPKYMHTTTVPQFALGEHRRGVQGAVRAAARGHALVVAAPRRTAPDAADGARRPTTTRRSRTA